MNTITVNGETQEIQGSPPIPDLLTQMGLDPRLVALEYNGEILPRQLWPKTLVQAGDRLEIVTMVGGG